MRWLTLSLVALTLIGGAAQAQIAAELCPVYKAALAKETDNGKRDALNRLIAANCERTIETPRPVAGVKRQAPAEVRASQPPAPQPEVPPPPPPVPAAQASLNGETAQASGDYAQAMHWFQNLAAGQGLAGAQVHIGYLYEHGLGVAADDAQAMHAYQLAAAQGDATAQLYIGYLYEGGLGVAVDHGQAMHWFQLAAAQNLAAAQARIGDLYLDGHGVAVDYAQAMHWFQLGAAQGDATAQAGISDLYLVRPWGRGGLRPGDALGPTRRRPRARRRPGKRRLSLPERAGRPGGLRQGDALAPTRRRPRRRERAEQCRLVLPEGSWRPGG